ncbi:Spo0E family sporulation regulatory protein-aspartic acid phosphatase [Clostridium frigoris]|uniref:Spo0E family sporulation regulatory protein-aspartic acid phosphatase n=1 Tax=Clostridium frigoris TaxID=205327 RepID=A0ABS6BV99_9CLOT|nr:Spo0E family sporulation regulatory protein-aspartic acid phosphatase [Clostridium frigoris]
MYYYKNFHVFTDKSLNLSKELDNLILEYYKINTF